MNLNNLVVKPSLERNVTISIPAASHVPCEKTNGFQGLSIQIPTEENYIYSDNSKDIQTLLELSDFREKLSIGLRVYHSGWEEEDHHDTYYLYNKVFRNELNIDDLIKINELNHYNSGKKYTFDLKVFNESFLNKYKLIPCVKEQYDNCQYKLFKRHYQYSNK